MIRKLEKHSLSTRADLQLVGKHREQFIDFLRNLGLPQEERNGWCLIFSEAVNNAVIHGSAECDAMHIRIEWWVEGQEVLLSILDEGAGPSVDQTRDIRLPEDEFQTNGRGLFILSEFCKRFEHWRSEGGYRLVLGKEYPGLDFEQAQSGQAGGLNEELMPVLDELSTCYESLSAFYQMGRTLVDSEGLGAFICANLENLKTAHAFDEVFVLLRSDIPEALIPLLKETPGVFYSDAAHGPLALAMDREDEFSWDDARLVDHEALIKGNSSGFAAPLIVRGNAFGLLVAMRKDGEKAFYAAELNNLRAFSELIAAILLQHSLREAREQEKVALRELELATSIQQNLLPLKAPEASGVWDIVLRQRCAKEVAGDYAATHIDAKGNLVMTVIDVMGKGVSAALLATIYRTAFEAQYESVPDLAKLMGRLNDLLLSQLGDLSMFITAVILRISPDGNKLEHVNAGHCPTIIVNKEGQVLRELEPSGAPLGLLEDTEYIVDYLKLAKDDGIMVVSDGCYEWVEPGAQDIVGWEAFVESSKSAYSDPEAFWQKLNTQIDVALDGAPAHDDLTFLFWKLKNR